MGTCQYDHDHDPDQSDRDLWDPDRSGQDGPDRDGPDHVVRGQILAALVMLLGISFITLITASITSAFVERLRREQESVGGDAVATAKQVQKLDARLERIEAALNIRA